MLQFRTAENTDLDAIKQLLYTSNLPIDGIDCILSDVIVIEHNSEIIGVAGIENHFPYALIRSVAIASEYQNKQLGSQIINTLMNNAETQNYKAYYLLTETANLFFEKYGFKIIGRENIPIEIKSTNEYEHICPSTAIVMIKEFN